MSNIYILYEISHTCTCTCMSIRMWEHCGVVVRALDSRVRGSGFESRSVRTPLDKAFCPLIVSLDPGVVNGYPAGIYSFECS